MRDRLTVNGVVLGVQTFGAATEPPLLLIAGAAASMASWPDEFCRELAAGGRHVVRYDHRDTGWSTAWPAGAAGYGLRDLAADAVALLDVLGLSRAHLVGVSLGGMIAQVIAVEWPERVASLTLLSSSPAPPEGADDLPSASLPVRLALADIDPPAPDDRDAAVDHLVVLARLRAGIGRAFDAGAARAAAERIVEHGGDAATAAINHALLEPGAEWRSRLGSVTAPALVVHGTADPILPPAHGGALAAELARADLLLIPYAGHEYQPADWAAIASAVLRHTGVTAPGPAHEPARSAPPERRP
jgi:pimeloyl-ACP methyl ester carboxylesterase